MNRIKCVLNSVFILLFVFTGFSAIAQEPEYSIPDLKTHYIKSKFVDQEFKILVSIPFIHDEGSERFPVLYCPDANFFYPRDITSLLQGGGEVPRFILVGIGYPGKHYLSSFNLRARDLTPVEGVIPMLTPETFVRGVHVPKDKKYGGAQEFLKFIRHELIPFIDENYPTLKGDRGYFGHSFGGLFGLFVLFDQPDTFNKYIIGSPGTRWGDEYIIKQAENYVAHHDELNASVFMSVGALEIEGEDASLFTNVSRIERILKQKKLKGLELSARVFPDETHLSVGYMNYIHGIKAVYGQPKVFFLQEFLEKLAAESQKKQ